MTPDTIRASIAQHQHLAQQDPEAWHDHVDDLNVAVLRAIEAGHDEPAALAAAALKAHDIPTRWHACA